MPSEATCAPNFCAGGVNSLHLRPAAKSGSGTSPPWQCGKPKCIPALGAWFSSSGGTSSPIMSRPLSVNHSSFVCGCQSKPTLFLTPRATTSMAEPSGFSRVMVP